MSVQVALEHHMSYRFDRAVRLSPHVVRLRPAPHCRTPILAYSLTVTPRAHFINWQQDPFGNHLARLVFPEPARELTVEVDLVADLGVINPFDFFVEETAERYPFSYDGALLRDLAPYFSDDEASPLLAQWTDDWLRSSRGRPDGQRIVDFLVEVNQRVARSVAYTVRMEPGVQTPDETLQKAVGSCRDSAWLLVHVLRRLGLAARFVSGYLVQLRPDEKPLDGPAGPTADFTDLHAWAETYLPGAGWFGLDPTSGLLAGEGHIPLVCSPHPASAAPISGATEPCEVTFEFTNTVRRLAGPPRVTLPYSEEQWGRVDALGYEVDKALAAGDVRLTLGGEPTFVAIDDMEDEQWTTAADGADKRARAEVLARRLLGRFAPGGLLHHGQGKWYPGEPLPRWQIALLWRADGEPLWDDRSLLASPVDAGTGPLDAGEIAGTGTVDAGAIASAIAGSLGLPEGCCIPAYEDPLHLLQVEASLPGGEPPATDMAPGDGSLASSDARLAAIAALDEDGREGPVGWVIPLHPLPAAWAAPRAVEHQEEHQDEDPGEQPDEQLGEQPGWATTRWTLRRGYLALVPGDSPIGLRLPLGSLTWRPDPPEEPEVSPFDEVSPLSARKAVRRRRKVKEVKPEEVPRGALCVEHRQGKVFVFLPPVQRLEQFVDLVGAVQEAAAKLRQSVVFEGYLPPFDPRLVRLMVTPDPGVLEVNIHPASSWPELVDITTGVHAEARATRLGTETFHLDGTHAGTGGGNHLTLGGPTPADSPLLRRPDLLRSIITYWQHHPSLSYLFSGRFIGPTSQAPRVDEARHESLYELEIAFAELDRTVPEGEPPPPWLVDRLFRNLLVDITGSTHRAELCIDKLFSPGSERGRLGLLELRGFEMPPHPRMALVQALLVRALVARFWAQPYAGPLVRWGTELHDRFLLPWYAAADITEVADDLARHGFGFDVAWLAPFLEFRFPRIGSVEVSGVTIELRGAIEPWSVLGEEVSSAGTSRYVDSSLERLQVRVEGVTAERHIVTCNRVAVPLHSTGTPGAYVAGVRYRAWKPPSSLHPTIGVHAPLVFD
ncbi:MAG TPA: transglutaminase family protein, partial [Acidimicrobiales bacterium]|nr:transglutaminase family protein [Acidimicrobiales bacterium]